MTKNRRNKKAKLGEDQISKFPDHILSHILSFLSTRDSVRTCILSRRWKSVWPFVSALNLDSIVFDEISNSNLFDFLVEVLLCRKMPCIETINIQGVSHSTASSMQLWLCAAIDRNPQELVLSFDMDFSFDIQGLPRSLFACSRLVVLKLHAYMMLSVPADFKSFPNLKVLELCRIVFRNSDSARDLISSCPVLEDLNLIRGHGDCLETLHVNSRVLKNLKVSRSGRERLYGRQTRLVIDAPALKSIDIFYRATDVYEVASDLSLVTEVKFHVGIYSKFTDSKTFGTCLLTLLKKISSVKFLSFSSHSMASVSLCESFNLPKFQDLTSFELYGRIKKTHISWELMMEILKCSPKLQNLFFLGFEFSWRKTGTCDGVVPKCVVSSLKTIKITELKRVGTLINLTYFLKNARVLEKVIIENGVWTEIQMSETTKRLSSIRRASPACQFQLC